METRTRGSCRFLIKRGIVMIFDILSAGGQLSVVGLFFTEMNNASRLGYFEHLWPAKTLPQPCADVKRKESQLTVASLSFQDKNKNIVVPSSQGRRIVLVPLTANQYALLFGSGCYCYPLSNVASHPQKLKGCEKFSDDFATALKLLYTALDEKGYEVRVS